MQLHIYGDYPTLDIWCNHYERSTLWVTLIFPLPPHILVKVFTIKGDTGNKAYLPW